MELPRMVPIWMGDEVPEKVSLSLPVDLLPDGETMFRLLTACGADKETASAFGRAPAYDKWGTVCRCLPLLSGHPVYRRLHALTRAAGYDLPLNADTAADSWRTISGHMAPEEGLTLRTLAEKICPNLSLPVRPERVPVGRPDIIDPNGLTAVLKHATAEDTLVLCVLPQDYIFTRPNPFRAAMMIRKAASGGRFSWDALLSQERDHLLTQILRITGGLCREAGRTLYVAGHSRGLEDLLPYLSDAGCLPDTVRLLTDPSDTTDALPPLFDAAASVRTGVWLEGDDTATAVAKRLSDYAARMPLLAADGLFVAVRAPFGLTAAESTERILIDLLRAWASDGCGAEI